MKRRIRQYWAIVILVIIFACGVAAAQAGRTQILRLFVSGDSTLIGPSVIGVNNAGHPRIAVAGPGQPSPDGSADMSIDSIYGIQLNNSLAINNGANQTFKSGSGLYLYGGSNVYVQGANIQFSSGSVTGWPGISSTTVIATNYSGADIGAQVNSAIAALPNGGVVIIPTGIYSFNTTIQCPIAANATIVIKGETRGPYHVQLGNSVADNGTVLNYTGTGDAINDIVTSLLWDGAKACEIENLDLIWPGSDNGTNAAGKAIHYGSVTNAYVHHVFINGFSVGIELDNNVQVCERWTITDDELDNNNVDVRFNETAASGLDSFAFGDMDIRTIMRATTLGARYVIQVNGTSGTNPDPYNSTFRIRGNIFSGSNNLNEQWLFYLGPTTAAYINNSKMDLALECDGALGAGYNCGRFNSGAAGEQIEHNIIDEHMESYTDTWTDANTAQITFAGDAVRCSGSGALDAIEAAIWACY